MPNEIQYAHLDPGLTTLTARLRTGTTDVVSGIALSDTSKPRWYVGSIPGGTADGDYEVVVYEGTELVGVGEYPMRWRSNAEVLPALLADIAPAVRTNLATELGRMDVAVSTRPTLAQVEASTVLAKEATVTDRPTLAQMIASTLAKTGDAMTLTTGERTSIAAAVWGATTRTLSSFGTLIADFWANATRTLTADPGAAAHSATQALMTAAAATNQAEHDATQSAVAGIGTATPIRADVRAINGQTVQGTGASNNKWRPAP
jgi:hypothetical protein